MRVLLIRGCVVLAASRFVVGHAPLLAQTIERGTLQRHVDSIIQDHLDARRIAGASIGVVYQGDTLLLARYGYADLENDVATPENAVYEIGSVTKQFTAVAILQLVDQGRIDLEADVTTYLPQYPTNGRSISIRRLMDHTSGIKGYTEMPGFAAIATRSLPRDSLVAMFSAAPPDFEPGEALIYNNSAYFLLGLIIEAVSGQSYEDYVAEHLFRAARLNDSQYCSNTEIIKHRARGYSSRPQGLVLINTTGPVSPGALGRTIAGFVLGQPASPSNVSYPGDLGEFVGTYYGPARGNALTVTVEHRGSGLAVRMGDGELSEVQFAGEQRFRLGDTWFSFLRHDDRISTLQVDQVSGLYVLTRQN